MIVHLFLNKSINSEVDPAFLKTGGLCWMNLLITGRYRVCGVHQNFRDLGACPSGKFLNFSPSKIKSSTFWHLVMSLASCNMKLEIWKALDSYPDILHLNFFGTGSQNHGHINNSYVMESVWLAAFIVKLYKLSHSFWP